MVIRISGLNEPKLKSLNQIMFLDGMPSVSMEDETATAYDLCGWQCDVILDACSVLGLTGLLCNH